MDRATLLTCLTGTDRAVRHHDLAAVAHCDSTAFVIALIGPAICDQSLVEFDLAASAVDTATNVGRTAVIDRAAGHF